jgi:hypothetical protein
MTHNQMQNNQMQNNPLQTETIVNGKITITDLNEGAGGTTYDRNCFDINTNQKLPITKQVYTNGFIGYYCGFGMGVLPNWSDYTIGVGAPNGCSYHGNGPGAFPEAYAEGTYVPPAEGATCQVTNIGGQDVNWAIRFVPDPN